MRHQSSEQPWVPVQAPATTAAAVPPPPPPPFLFASNTLGGGSLTSASASGAFPSTIGDVYTYAPAGGGSIESAAGVGPQTTALTTSNGALSQPPL